MNGTFKRFTALLLAMIMVLSCAPMEAMAALVPVSQQNASGSVSIMRIVVPDETADTYEFYNGNTLVQIQKVIENDFLYEPGTPASEADPNAVFMGWYIGENRIAFNADGHYTVSSVSGTTVRVNAVFSNLVYATFYDQDGRVYSRIGVESGETVDTSSLSNFTPKQSTQNLAGWSTDASGDPAYKVDFDNYTITANTSFYPIIETGYWIHFDANRSHVAGMENVNVSYTPPLFVKQGQSTVAPTKNPTADIAAYTFEGWYTDADCTTRFN